MLINPFSSGHQGRHGHEFLGAPSTYLHRKEFKLMFSNRVWFSGTGRRQECICAICKQLQLPKWFPHPERKCVDNLPYDPGFDWFNFLYSVRQFTLDWWNQAHHQDQRNYEVYCSRLCQIQHLCLHRNREDDAKWPQKNKDGRQELEIKMGNEHISFEVREVPLHCQISSDLIFFLDGQNWISRRCYGIPRSGGLACLLLSRSRSKGFGFLSHSATFQDQANLGRRSHLGAGSGSWELTALH